MINLKERFILRYLFASAVMIAAPVSLRAEQPQLFDLVVQESAASQSANLSQRSFTVRASDLNLLNVKQLSVPLPDLGVYTLEVRSAKITSDGYKVFSGELTSKADSKTQGNLTISVDKSGQMLGSISLLAPHFRAVIKGQSLKVLSDKLALGCGGSLKPVPEQTAAASARAAVMRAQAASTSDASTVDVLGVYTTDTLTQLGSYSRVVSYFQNQITISNEAHAASSSEITLRLAGIVALPSRSTDDYENDLGSLADSSDGIWDIVPTLRAWYGADLVSLAVGGTGGGTICGLAYTPGSEADLAVMSDYMYSVISADTDSCQESIMAHEVGHNLGANHNSEDAGEGDVIYPYAYGYRFDYPYEGETVKALTVMSYAPDSGSFGWIRYFSTPDASFNSYVTGVADEADNARAFRSTGPVVAAFKTARSSLPINASSIALTATKSGSAVTFRGTLKRSSTKVSSARSVLYYSSRSTGSFTRVVKADTSNSAGRWSYKKSRATKGYYKLCQSVCSKAVRVK